MAFPQTVLPLAVELQIDGVWTRLPVYRRSMVNVTRGRSDEGGTTDRSTMSFDLDNRSGNYSPRNPNSTLYGLIGRNTPIRASLEDATPYLEVTGSDASYAVCNDAPTLGITGDIDIRADVTLNDWASEFGADIAGKWTQTSDERSWAFYLGGGYTGQLVYQWSTAGTVGTVLTATATVSVPPPRTGRLCVRATHDVNNGAGGNTVTFYTATSMAGPWVQLGDAVTAVGTTSIYDGTSIVELADILDIGTGPFIGRYHMFELRSGIGGTVVTNPNFALQDAGDTTFTDTAPTPINWGMGFDAEISNRNYRFHGEVSSWPQRWDTTGTDVHVPIESSGVLQRLGNSAEALQSVMYRGMIFDTEGLVAYWPMEDAEGATQLAAALDTHQSMSITGSPQLAAYDQLPSSFPFPILHNASFSGAAPSYVVGNETQVRFLMVVPASGAETGQVVVMFYTTGTVRRWELQYTTAAGGSLTLLGYDGAGAQLFTSGAQALAVNGLQLLVSIELTQSGANIVWNMLTLEPGAGSGLTVSATLNSQTVGKVGIITVSPGGGMDQIAIGHLSIQNTITTLFELAQQLGSWSGDRAGRRVQRLCSEAGVAFTAIGGLDDTALMGPQMPGAILALIREAVATDLGLLYEPRERFGLGYRTRTSMYNQQPQLALSYTANNLANSLDPIDDDQSTHNDVTVNRPNGSSARSILTGGALSILAPPLGVGRYSSSDSVNVAHDLHLQDQARWRLHLGTVDEARYPQISINLAHRSFWQSATLPGATISLEQGDRVTIAHLPDWLPPEDASMIVQGYAEMLGNFEHTLVLNCSPESPYRTGVYGSGNLATNGTFETNTTGWTAITNSGIARVTSPTFAGAGVLQITRTAANAPNHIHGAVCNDVDAGANTGELAFVEFWVRLPAATFSKVLQLAVSATGFASTFITKPTVADTWTRCTLPAVALTANLDDISIQFWTDGTLSNGNVVAQIDAFSIRLMAETSEVDRYQPETSTCAEAMTTTETDMDVATTSGPLWTTDDEEFPFDIMVGGERMRVVDIAGSSSPQVFTVIRSINGIVKTHAIGAVVKLFHETIYGL